MLKAAYTNKAMNLAEDIVSQQLAEKYQRSLKAEMNKKKIGPRMRKAIREQASILNTKPQWWINLNKGLLVEFIIFLVLQGFNFFTNCWVLVPALTVLSRMRSYQQAQNVTVLNFTAPGICEDLTLWDKAKIDEEVTHFEAVAIVYCLFMALTSILLLTHTLSWLYTLYLSMEKKEIGEKGRSVLIKMKLVFLLGASLLQDIPLSTLTAEIFAVQQGKEGIICWLCKVAGGCGNQKELQSYLDQSQSFLVLNIVAISVTSLWKGISSFYRWSRIPNFEMFFIRACTSLFVGFLFIIVILTPAMLVLTYRYYEPNGTGGLIKDLIDRIVIIGIIFWVMVLTVMFCCPLLNMIRVGNK
ncbi:uncharacterized protein LOC110236405 [Exaiptasia diaphana]|uniref:Uncharacterized protein n=1 Tax=Exaiptasia diaphana TaxID=2652724 RepID=A0A913X1W6_EXADI|nr:uncharacterized protein LOC110236405 [Exaiptasia diaphana]